MEQLILKAKKLNIEKIKRLNIKIFKNWVRYDIIHEDLYYFQVITDNKISETFFDLRNNLITIRGSIKEGVKVLKELGFNTENMIVRYRETN